MYRFWSHIIEPLCEALEARRIVEVGIGQGRMTRLLIAYAAANGGHIDAIDPAPDCDMDALCADGAGVLTFHPAASLDVLPKLSGDVVLLDGDHNWYTVRNELRVVAGWPVPPVIVLHDTAWPYGRRDMYYDRERIPEEYLQPSLRRGMRPGVERVTMVGGLNAHLENAITEGGPRNGVLTAVEDFLSDADRGWRFHHLPVIHGLGILAPPARGGGPALSAFLEELEFSPACSKILEKTEWERLRELTHNAVLERQARNHAETLERMRAREREYVARIRRLEPLEQEVQRLHRHSDRFERDSQGTQAELTRLRQTRSVRWTAGLRRLEAWLRGKNRP